MANRAMVDDIEHKIAHFAGQPISFGYLSGRNENLLPMTDEIRESSMGNRYPDAWYKRWEVEDASSRVTSWLAPKLPEFYVAKRRIFNRKKPKLLDIYEIYDHLLVSTKVRDLIEAFDPDATQSAPAELRNKLGEVVSDDYHFMQILRYIDIQGVTRCEYDRDQTALKLPLPKPRNTFVPSYWLSITDNSDVREFLLSKPCWVVQYCESESKHFSGSLVKKLLEEKCTGLKPYKNIQSVTKGEVLYYL